VKNFIALFFAILTVNIPAATASESGPKRGFFAAIPDELISPVTTDALPWFLGMLGATGVVLIFEDDIVDPTQRGQASVACSRE
jgi:hypothetical protein